MFARKTYRFFEGGDVTKDDIVRLLERSGSGARPRGLDTLGFAELGEILRYFGQFSSADRLLPKYGYASPVLSTRRRCTSRSAASTACGPDITTTTPYGIS